LGGFLAIHLCLVLIATTAVPNLDDLIHQTGGQLVTIAEGLVLMLLVLHGTGGIRVLIHEGFSTRRLDRPLALLGVACALLTPFAWCLSQLR
jgi:succinate dehydrogenase/fumarate reductase cytochrome b subunit